MGDGTVVKKPPTLNVQHPTPNAEKRSWTAYHSFALTLALGAWPLPKERMGRQDRFNRLPSGAHSMSEER
jgi:hypothetical protein